MVSRWSMGCVQDTRNGIRIRAEGERVGMRGVIKGNCKRCGGPFECKRRSQVYCSIQCANTALADKASDRMATIQATTAWSCGGGVDSTAIAMLIIEGKLPKPDLAWMVDVGGS